MFNPQKPEDVLKNFQALAGPQAISRMATLVTDPTFTNLYNLAYATSSAKPTELSALLTSPTPQNLIQVANLWSQLKTGEKSTSSTPQSTVQSSGVRTAPMAFGTMGFSVGGGPVRSGEGIGTGYSEQPGYVPPQGPTPVLVTLKPASYGPIESRVTALLIDNYGSIDWLAKNSQSIATQTAWLEANKNQISDTFSIQRLTPQQVSYINAFGNSKPTYDAWAGQKAQLDTMYNNLYVQQKNGTSRAAGIEGLLTAFGSTKDSADQHIKDITADYIDTNIQAKIDAAVADVKLKVDSAPTVTAIDTELQARLQDAQFRAANLDPYIRDVVNGLLPPYPSTILDSAKGFLDTSPPNFLGLGTGFNGLGTNLTTLAPSFDVNAMQRTLDPKITDLTNKANEVDNHVNAAKAAIDKWDVKTALLELTSAVLAAGPALTAASDALKFVRNNFVDVSNGFNKVGQNFNDMSKFFNNLGAKK